MKERSVSPTWYPAVTALIGILAGVGLETIAELAAKSEPSYGAWITSAIVLSLVTFTALLLVRTTTQLERDFSRLSDELVEARSLAATQATEYQAALMKLADKVPLHIDYIDVSVDGSEAMFDRAGKIVCKAERTIRVLTSYLIDIAPHSGEHKAAKRKYFQTIMNHVKASSGKVGYFRLVQHQQGQGLDSFFADASYGEHLLEMLRAAGPHRIYAHMTQHSRPTTYVVIDNEYLLWQINAISAGSVDQMEMLGMFIIHDPKGELIKHFKISFERLWNSGGEITLQEAELAANRLPEANDKGLPTQSSPSAGTLAS